MYAIIQTGGKQYRVQPGDIIQIEKLAGEKGAKVDFNEVLFVSNGTTENTEIFLGTPTLAGAKVNAEVVGQGRDEKITIVKMKRRKQYRRTQGHRQEQTQVLITGVSNGAGLSKSLEASAREALLKKFQSHLKAKGPAFSTPKSVLKGQAKMLARTAGLKSVGTTKTAAPKTAAKKAPAKKAAK